MRRERFLKTARLLTLCVLAALLAAGCGDTREAEPTATPIPQQTVNPSLPEGVRRLEEKLLAGAADALRLEADALRENSAIVSVRVPDQILNQFLDALSDDHTWEHKENSYLLTVTSGGQYVYEKPYSETITGSSTDVYTIPGEPGEVEEIVDNTRYDPMTWVMSGEGGGAFDYMSVYELRDDASGGSIVTVSQLNGQVSGWSYDEFAVRDGHYCFMDVQLSPNEEGLIEAPYQWILCLGDISAEQARIEEITLETQALELPAEELKLSAGMETLFSQAAGMGRRRSLLTARDGTISYTESIDGE